MFLCCLKELICASTNHDGYPEAWYMIRILFSTCSNELTIRLAEFNSALITLRLYYIGTLDDQWKGNFVSLFLKLKLYVLLLALCYCGVKKYKWMFFYSKLYIRMKVVKELNNSSKTKAFLKSQFFFRFIHNTTTIKTTDLP